MRPEKSGNPAVLNSRPRLSQKGVSTGKMEAPRKTMLSGLHRDSAHGWHDAKLNTWSGRSRPIHLSDERSPGLILAPKRLVEPEAGRFALQSFRKWAWDHRPSRSRGGKREMRLDSARNEPVALGCIALGCRRDKKSPFFYQIPKAEADSDEEPERRGIGYLPAHHPNW